LIGRRLAFVLAALLATGCPALEPPDERARGALADLAASGFSAAIPGSPEPLRVPPGKLSFTGIHAEPDKDGTLRVFGQLSLDGWVGPRPVSYLGAEALAVTCGTTCRVEGTPVPRLVGVLAALVPDAGERDAGGWFIRVDRDAALVAEASRDGTRFRRNLVREGDRWVEKHGAP
jgi:hypothetical protein